MTCAFAGGAGAAADVHARLAVFVLVHAITQAVRAVAGGTDDQGAGREEGDPPVTAQGATSARNG
jgi:hypothetical protein